jgi:hypothetical protein
MLSKIFGLILFLVVAFLWHAVYVRSRAVLPESRYSRWLLEHNPPHSLRTQVVAASLSTFLFLPISYFLIFITLPPAPDWNWTSERVRLEAEFCKSRDHYPYALIKKELCECVIVRASSDDFAAKVGGYDMHFPDLQLAKSVIGERQTNGRALTDDEVLTVVIVEEKILKATQQCVLETALDAQHKVEQAIEDAYREIRRSQLQ